MIYPSPDKLDRTGSKYALVIVAAKRARQLKDGAPQLVHSTSANPLTVALEELAEGVVVPLQVGTTERLPDSVAQEPVLQGLVSSAVLGDDDDDPSAVKAALLGTHLDEEYFDSEMDASDEDDLDARAVDDEMGDVSPSLGLTDLDTHEAEDESDAEEEDDIILRDDDTEVSLEEMVDAEQNDESDDLEE